MIPHHIWIFTISYEIIMTTRLSCECLITQKIPWTLAHYPYTKDFSSLPPRLFLSFVQTTSCLEVYHLHPCGNFHGKQSEPDPQRFFSTTIVGIQCGATIWPQHYVVLFFKKARYDHRLTLCPVCACASSHSLRLDSLSLSDCTRSVVDLKRKKGLYRRKCHCVVSGVWYLHFPTHFPLFSRVHAEFNSEIYLALINY